MHFPKPHITPDGFFHETTPPSASTTSWPITIYFISGNPGLISYYHTFLSSLAGKLAPSSELDPEKPSTFHIFGHSLAGFELAQEPENGGNEQEAHYYDLEEQICFAQGKLEMHMKGLRKEYYATAASGEGSSRPRPKVILIGHSVGTYMAMEILRRHHENLALAQASSGSGPESGSDDDNDGFDIIGGIMLFPTVKDLAKSPSGRKLTVRMHFFLLRLVLSQVDYDYILIQCAVPPPLDSPTGFSRIMLRPHFDNASPHPHVTSCGPVRDELATGGSGGRDLLVPDE
jgi:hypothetical protein